MRLKLLSLAVCLIAVLPMTTYAATRAELLVQIEQLTQVVFQLQILLEARQDTTSINLTKNLYLGVRDEEVSNLQRFLRNTGDFTYPEITGYYGSITALAVQRYQCRTLYICSGSPNLNGYGVVGPKTRTALQSQVAKLANNEPKKTSKPTPTGGGVGGGGSTPPVPEPKPIIPKPEPKTPVIPKPDPKPVKKVDGFMWFGYSAWDVVGKPEMFENILTSMKFRNQALVVAVRERYNDTMKAEFSELLDRTSEAGVPVWLEIGSPSKDNVTAEKFVEDKDRREAYLNHMTDILSVYFEKNVPGHCRMFAFDEAPSNSPFWMVDGTNTSIERSHQYIKESFAYIKSRVKKAAANKGVYCDVGIFLEHNAFESDSSHAYSPGVSRAEALALPNVKGTMAEPDFIFLDWYNSQAEASSIGERLADKIKTATSLGSGGKDVYFLGQVQTNNSGDTPEQHEIDNNIKIAHKNGVEAVGFYHQSHKATQNSEGFIHNNLHPSGASRWKRVAEMSRDRWDYASLRTQEIYDSKYDTGRYFDLWIDAKDIDGYEVKVSLLNNETKKSEVIGYLNGNLNDSLYDTNHQRSVHIIRRLPRALFMGSNGDMSINISDHVPFYIKDSKDFKNHYDYSAESPRFTIYGIYAMPATRGSQFIAETDATDKLQSKIPNAWSCYKRGSGLGILGGEFYNLPLEKRRCE